MNHWLTTRSAFQRITTNNAGSCASRAVRRCDRSRSQPDLDAHIATNMVDQTTSRFAPLACPLPLPFARARARARARHSVGRRSKGWRARWGRSRHSDAGMQL